MPEKLRPGSQFVGYVPAGTVVTPELIAELSQGLGARRPYDLELKANVVEAKEMPRVRTQLEAQGLKVTLVGRHP